MTYDDLLPLLKSASSGRPTSKPAIESLAAWLRDTLSALPDHKTLTTRDLMALAGVPWDDTVALKRFNSALYWVRQSGLVSDCFRRDSYRKMAGHPLVLYHKAIPKIEEEPSAD